MAEGININNRFVSQEQIDERRQKRQEEWEKVRKPDDPKEAPEEVVDNRSLYEKLEENKAKKQDDFDEQHKMRNQVQGLKEDEAQFLDFVSKRQEEVKKARQDEDLQVIREYKEAMITSVQAEQAEKPAVKKPAVAKPGSQKRSQLTLLAGAVKRKSTDANSSETDDKKRKRNSSDENAAEGDSNTSSAESRLAPTPEDAEDKRSGTQTGKVIAVLPGLGVYSDSSDSDSCSSEEDVNTDIFTGHAINVVVNHR